jgi:hypothetical protein
VVIDALVDPNVPIVPPEMKPEQREKLERALSGDADASEVREQVGKQTRPLTAIGGAPMRKAFRSSGPVRSGWLR